MLSNPRLDRFILLVSLLAAGVAHSQESRYSWEAVSNIPSWFKTGIATALIDPMPGVSSETLLLPFVVQAVSEINPNERELRRRIIDVLVARVEKDQDNRVKSNAIKALIELKPEISKQRYDVVNALNNLINDVNNVKPSGPLGELQLKALNLAAISALITIETDDAGLREAAATTLLKRLVDPDNDAVLPAAQALNQVTLDNPRKRHDVVAALIRHLDEVDAVRIVQATLPFYFIVPDDPMQRYELFSTLIMKRNGNAFASAGSLLSKNLPEDGQYRHDIVASLLTFLETDEGANSFPAVETLAYIRPDSQPQRDQVYSTLLKLLNSPSETIVTWVVKALVNVAMDDQSKATIS